MNIVTMTRVLTLAGLVGASFLSGCSDATELRESPVARTKMNFDKKIVPNAPKRASSYDPNRVFTNPLRIPEEAVPEETAPAQEPGTMGLSTSLPPVYYRLSIHAMNVQMLPGPPTPMVGFAGRFPGPTLRAERGIPTVVTQANDWTENVTIHNHGHKVSAESDGHPVDYILPGKYKNYYYPNDQRAGTFWYHDHTMDLTGAHVYAGLAGFYIIHDKAEDILNLPSGSYDVPLLLQDRTFVENNELYYFGNPHGWGGPTPVINGTANPVLNVAARKYRLRLLNGCNARTLNLHFSVQGKPVPFQLISSDGGLLEAPVPMKAITVNPGERYDVVMDFTNFPVNTVMDLLNDDDPEIEPLLPAMMQFKVTHTEVDRSTVPPKLSTIDRLKEKDAKAFGNVELGLSADGETWTLNGTTYDPARIDIRSKRDTVTIWTLKNATDFTHPFHKHLVQFTILDINGQPPPPELAGWKDTVGVPGNGSMRIIFKNEKFSGTYVLHCHRLEHEDHRMMIQESVEP